MDKPDKPRGLLGDTSARDYSRKLQSFNAFAEPEIRRAMAGLDLRPGMRVLDAGCGTGEAMGWLSSDVGPDGMVVGIDLAAPHVVSARGTAPADALVMQADLQALPFAPGSFDLIWSVNTVNHLRDPVDGLRLAASLLRPGGRIALGQSSLLPDMYFAWDSRLERLVNEAVRQYYRDRYHLDERDLASVRSIVGLLRAAGLHDVTVLTQVIERVAPVRAEDERYLVETIFRDSWGERLQPYLSRDDYEALGRLCDPRHPDFALRRPDFHFLQTFTLAVGNT
jgi:SAM-dependent methyltransferase